MAARRYITAKDRKALIVAAADEPLPAGLSSNQLDAGLSVPLID